MVSSSSDLSSVHLAAHCCHHHALTHPRCSALLSPSCCSHHSLDWWQVFNALLSLPRCRHYSQYCPPQKRSTLSPILVLKPSGKQHATGALAVLCRSRKTSTYCQMIKLGSNPWRPLASNKFFENADLPWHRHVSNGHTSQRASTLLLLCCSFRMLLQTYT